MKFIIARTYPEYRYIVELCKLRGIKVSALDNLPSTDLPLAFDISGPILGFTDSLDRAIDYQEFADFVVEWMRERR